MFYVVYCSFLLVCGFKTWAKTVWFRFSEGTPTEQPEDLSCCLLVKDVSSKEFSQLKFEKNAGKQYSHPPIFPCRYSVAVSSHASAQMSPHSPTSTPTHALIWPLQKPVTVSGPLPWEDKLPVMATTFCGIHIRGKTKEVSRSRGITLKLFILCILLPSPLCLSSTLFCQLTTRATVSLFFYLTFLGI